MNIFSKNIFIILLTIGLILSSLFGYFFYVKETNTLKVHLEKVMNYEITSFQRELFFNFEPLHIIQGIFTQSISVKKKEFYLLSSTILKNHNNIKSILWLPNVIDFNNKKIKNKKTEYSFPIKYSLSLSKIPFDLGFDLYSNERFRKFFKTLKKNKDNLFIASLNLSQSLLHKKSLLIFLPIYRENFLKGFVLCEFDTNALFSEIITVSKNKGINIVIEDITNYENKVLYKKINILKEDKTFKLEKVFKNIGGRTWKISATPDISYIDKNRSILPYLITFIGIIFVLLCAFYTFVIMKRNIIVSKLVKEKTNELLEVNEKLELLSRTDSLTNISNRRYFNEYLKKEWNRAIREKTSLSIIMSDIDYFKQYNDTYGHLEGDICLKNIALCLKDSINRSTDLLARYGGEEFVIVLQNTNSPFSLAVKVIKSIENLKIPHKNSKVSEFVTMSIGIITVSPNKDNNILDFLQKADDALYQAKEKGRNQVVYYDNI